MCQLGVVAILNKVAKGGFTELKELEIWIMGENVTDTGSGRCEDPKAAACVLRTARSLGQRKQGEQGRGWGGRRPEM